MNHCEWTCLQSDENEADCNATGYVNSDLIT